MKIHVRLIIHRYFLSKKIKYTKFGSCSLMLQSNRKFLPNTLFIIKQKVSKPQFQLLHNLQNYFDEP